MIIYASFYSHRPRLNLQDLHGPIGFALDATGATELLFRLPAGRSKSLADSWKVYPHRRSCDGHVVFGVDFGMWNLYEFVYLTSK